MGYTGKRAQIFSLRLSPDIRARPGVLQVEARGCSKPSMKASLTYLLIFRKNFLALMALGAGGAGVWFSVMAGLTRLDPAIHENTAASS
jgi:hypothetical protein